MSSGISGIGSSGNAPGANGQDEKDIDKEMQKNMDKMKGITSLIDGMGEAGKENLGMAKKTTESSSKATDDANAAGRAQSQGVNPANKSDNSSKAADASQGAAIEAANQRL